MRIISGEYKGKKILQPKDKETRPLKDLTKESIFNILTHSKKFSVDLKNSYILDLFSGTGSFGLECLSRGSKYVAFIENYKDVLPILKKNLSNLNTKKNYEIFDLDIVKNFNFKKLSNQFDVIFLDPPYKEKNIKDILINIFNEKIINKNGIVIIHRHKKELDDFPSNFKIVEKKKLWYIKDNFWFLRLRQNFCCLFFY